jgi:hypothetical protein
MKPLPSMSQNPPPVEKSWSIEVQDGELGRGIIAKIIVGRSR